MEDHAILGQGKLEIKQEHSGDGDAQKTFEAVQAQAMYKRKDIFDKRNTKTQTSWRCSNKLLLFHSRRQEILKIRDAINFWRCFTQTTMFHTDNKSMFHFSRAPCALQLHVGQWDWQRRKITDQCLVWRRRRWERGEAKQIRSAQHCPALPSRPSGKTLWELAGICYLLGSLCD